MFRRTSIALAALCCAVTAAMATPSPGLADEVRDEQWYTESLKLDEAHELSQGEGVTIGLIDSGVDADHPDLKGNVEAGTDFGDSTGDGLEDVDGHGTNMASLLVGHGHGEDGSKGIIGIAPKATVISVGLHCKSQCDGGALINNAIEWLVEQKVDVISISLSAYSNSNAAIDQAVQSGIAVVASAGNSTPEDHEILGKVKPPDSTSWPAMASGAIPVAGSNAKGEFWGDSMTLTNASAQPQLGLSAPAENIVAAEKNGGYATHSGTSASAPIVAGTLALIKSAYPNLSNLQLIDRLLDTVDDKGTKGFDNKFGFGIVNPIRSLTEETTYAGKDGDQVSSPDDRIPLEEQGNGASGNSSDTEAESNQDRKMLSGSTSSTLLLLGGLVGVLIAVILMAWFARRRFNAKSKVLLSIETLPQATRGIIRYEIILGNSVRAQY